MSEGQTPTHVDRWGWTPEEREAVLAACRVVQAPTSPAGTVGGKTWPQVRRLIREDETFAAAYREARAAYLDSLEHVTHGAAFAGYVETTKTEDPDGRVTRTEHTRIDNRLRLAILAAQRPETWGKRETIEHTGAGGGGIEIIGPAAARALEARGPEPHPKDGEEGAS